LRGDTHRSTPVTQTQTLRYIKPALTVNELKYVLANLDYFTGSHRRRIKLLLHSLLAPDVTVKGDAGTGYFKIELVR
jgi:hypothetical protein